MLIYLVESTRKGLEQRTEESAPRPETTPAFGGLLNLSIGWDAKFAAKARRFF